MAIWPFGYTEATSVDEDNDFYGGGGLLRTPLRQRRWKFKTIREYLQDSLVFLNGLKLSSSRIAMQELISANALTDDDWYVIAISDEEVGSQSISGEFVCNFGNVSLGCIASFTHSSVAKTHEDTTIKMVKPSKLGTASPANGILSFRLNKNDTDVSSGVKLLVKLQSSASTLKLITQLTNNISGVGLSGWKLVEPTTTDNDKCPDGSAATFLEAGEEIPFGNETINGGVFARKLSDDVISCSVTFSEIVKIGTVLTLTLPSTNYQFTDGDGTSVNLGAHTISNVIYSSLYQINYRINAVGAFATLIGGPLAIRVTGTGCKLTIT